MPKKSIIIAGVPRSGKTQLSRRLAKETSMSHCSVDAFVSAFEVAYPDMDLTGVTIRPGDLNKKMDKFFFSFIEEMDYEKIPFILDTCHTMPSRFTERNLLDKYNIIFIGYTDIKVEDKLKIIRKYSDEFDWTNKRDDADISKLIEEFIDVSKMIKKECLEHNIPYFDTSENFEDAIDQAYREITKG